MSAYDDLLRDVISEAEAVEARNHRQARYWLTGLAIAARATKLREYIGKLTRSDIEFLHHDPKIGEAIHNLHALSAELSALASALGQREKRSAAE
jgi:hypothetical protein